MSREIDFYCSDSTHSDWPSALEELNAIRAEHDLAPLTEDDARAGDPFMRVQGLVWVGSIELGDRGWTWKGGNAKYATPRETWQRVNANAKQAAERAAQGDSSVTNADVWLPPMRGNLRCPVCKTSVTLTADRLNRIAEDATRDGRHRLRLSDLA